MKISVITVCWNAGKTIRYTVESFLAQTHADKEMIIIDGASTDVTLDIVRSYRSPLIKIYSEKDKGIYDAMNKGLSLYTGDAVGFLNADDVYSSDKSLAVIAAALENSPMISGAMNLVPEHTSGKIDRVWRPGSFAPGIFKNGWALPHPSTYAKRSVYDTVGNFDVSYRIAGDYDWMIRALEIHNTPCLVLSDILTNLQLGGLSTSGPRASIANVRETSRARRKWLNAGIVDRAMLAKVWGRARRILG
jgi:glycosyltransferase involved in cell wall biosynthesis